ncbi:hypothetical protein [Psychroflexus salis]|uniref:Uncharacterized protein n=1 Tax=Psychroflexus salis TaxID=1526574 RepID=A0A916ZWN3_9FLAO|nr:hypothetical protein [Psychroflexus salis]GGE16945.1 hypothetical protein GCM10010831_17790 [Psychroflexus salis]
MIEPKFIKSDDDNKLSLNYDELRAKGITFIEKFSGNQWTDYNYHDPGITILEQVCYAITDLGYRTNFSIEDILQIRKGNSNLGHNNLLYGPEEVFPSSPSTINDFRKVFLDQIPSIKNIWIKTLNNTQGISGLFQIFVQLNDNLTEDQISYSVNQINKVFNENRPLSTDIDKITILKKDIIELSGKLTLDSFVVGEQVLAEIYFHIEKYFSNEHVEHKAELTNKTLEQHFEGPKLSRPIPDKFLKNKTKEIFISEVKEIIENVEGVLSLENFYVLKNNIKCYDNIITFEEDKYPVLKPLNYQTGRENSLSVFKATKTYDIDLSIYNQIFESLKINNYHSKLRLSNYKKELTNGKYSHQEIEEYFSIQRELPSVYGLKENELPSNSSKKRKSQSNQLRGYLLLFEQVMANHLSQLSHLKSLFSANKDSIQTYFNQAPVDIPYFNDLIGFESIESYRDFVKNISESTLQKINRKNQVIDHLIARYGESLETSLLHKLLKLNEPELCEEKAMILALEIKMKYARSIINLGYNRNKAQNYLSNKETTSGLLDRLNIILGLSEAKQSLTQEIYNSSKIEKGNKVWVEKTIKIDNKKSRKAIAIEDDNYSSEDFNFHCTNYKDYQELFINAINRNQYEIVKSEGLFHVFFKANNQLPVKVYASNTREKCEEKIDLAINKFRHLNTNCEGIYVIENILLRPYLEESYLVEVKNNSKVILTSYYAENKTELESLQTDLKILGKDKTNYSISSQEGKFQPVVYDVINQPLFKSNTYFTDKEEAEKEIDQLVGLFKTSEDDIVFEAVKSSEELKFPNDFNYSNQINLVMPDWPLRFQHKEFRELVEKSIKNYIPAHLSFNIFYLSVQQMHLFENTYQDWKVLKLKNSSKELAKLSLQLIQLLKSYR